MRIKVYINNAFQRETSDTILLDEYSNKELARDIVNKLQQTDMVFVPIKGTLDTFRFVKIEG